MKKDAVDHHDLTVRVKKKIKEKKILEEVWTRRREKEGRKLTIRNARKSC